MKKPLESANGCVAQRKQEAKRLIQHKQFKEAKLLLLELIEQEPDNFTLYTKLGDIGKELHEYRQAAQYYQTSIHLQPSKPNANVYIKYGNLLHEHLSNTPKAQQMYQQCIELNCPNSNDQCWFYFGKLMFNLNQYHKAEQYFLKCKKERACIHYHLSKVYLTTNKSHKAKLSLQKATKIKPNVVMYHYQYALCLRQLKLYSEAQISFEKALELCHNTDIQILYDFADMFSVTNDITNALKYLQIACDQDTNHAYPHVHRRYLELQKQCDDDDENKYDANEEKIDDTEDTDEWETVHDFVFAEYIRDICDELPSNLLDSLDEFMAKMTIVGIKSAKSRSRALHILEQLNKHKECDVSMIAAHKIADGHTLGGFKCIQCHKPRTFGGIELSNCLHTICYTCFQQQISQDIKYRTVPVCAVCGYTINDKDIKSHIDVKTADMVKTIKTISKPTLSNPYTPSRYSSMSSAKYNHYFGNYHISLEEFKGYWVHIEDINNSNMSECFEVVYDSMEWHQVLKHVRDPQERKIQRIERIQNAKIWRSFWNYCIEQRVKKGLDIEVGGFWHGTQGCKPINIWKESGFDTRYARIGNCLWFATENTYSMNGWEHMIHRNKKQVFLAFVATGNESDCTFIRNNEILNVFKNEATYPAYLITYADAYDLNSYYC